MGENAGVLTAEQLQEIRERDAWLTPGQYRNLLSYMELALRGAQIELGPVHINQTVAQSVIETLRALISGAHIFALCDWVPWKGGDELPMPQFHTSWLCTVRRMGTIDPTWLAVREGGQFDDGTSTEVIAYLPRPLPAPYTGGSSERA